MKTWKPDLMDGNNSKPFALIMGHDHKGMGFTTRELNRFNHMIKNNWQQY